MIICLVCVARVGVPALAMFNCTGWHEGSMAVSACAVDLEFLRDMANGAYAVVMIATFMGGVPVVIYLGVLIMVARLTCRAVGGAQTRWRAT